VANVWEAPRKFSRSEIKGQGHGATRCFCAAEASVRRCGVEGDLLYDDDNDCDDDDLNDDEYYFIKLSEP